MDAHSTLADTLVPLLVDAHGRVDTDDALADFRGDADLDALVTLLDGWDRQMRRDSHAAVAFRAFAFQSAFGVLRDELGALLDAALEIPVGSFIILKVASLALSGGYPEGDAVVQEGSDVVLLTAAREVAAWLDDAATYGDLHGAVFDATFRGDLDVGFTPTDGAEDTIDNAPASFSLEEGARWESRFGPVFRVVTGFAEDGTPEARVTLPLGNAGDPASPHFGDTLEGWVEGDHRPFAFRRADVEARMERREVLSPAP